jgi:hypothetical protein
VNRIELYHFIGLHLGRASLWPDFRDGGPPGVVEEYQPDSFLTALHLARRGSSWPSGDGSPQATGLHLLDHPRFIVRRLPLLIGK